MNVEFEKNSSVLIVQNGSLGRVISKHIMLLFINLL